MPQLNKVFLMGHLTRDPDMRTSQAGNPVCKFGIAVNRREKDKGADFINCTAFGKTAEFINRDFLKGSPIFIEGRLSYSSWKTEAGENRSALEVVVDRIDWLSPRKPRQGDTDDPSLDESVGEPLPTEPARRQPKQQQLADYGTADGAFEIPF